MRGAVVLLVGLMLSMPTSAEQLAHADILLVEQALAERNYQPGKVDGLFSDDTAGAIRDFEADWELPASGEISPDVLDRLAANHPSTKARWQQVDNRDCLIWNAEPQAFETVLWDGACVDGRVHGQGTLSWRYRKNGQWMRVDYTGVFRKGREYGPISVRAGVIPAALRNG